MPEQGVSMIREWLQSSGLTGKRSPVTSDADNGKKVSTLYSIVTLKKEIHVHTNVVDAQTTHVCSNFVGCARSTESEILFVGRKFTYGWITSTSIWEMCLGNII